MEKIKEILQTLKPAKGIQLAAGVYNIFDGKNSSWFFKMNFQNYMPNNIHVVLLNSNIPSKRIVKTTFSSPDYF